MKMMLGRCFPNFELSNVWLSKIEDEFLLNLFGSRFTELHMYNRNRLYYKSRYKDQFYTNLIKTNVI